MSEELSKGDAVVDQLHAEIRDAARHDIDEWGRFGRKINDAANTRLAARRTVWTPEEQYRLIRLAHLAHGIVTGRMLGRDV